MADFLGHSTIMRRLVEILHHSPMVNNLSFRYFAMHSNLDFNDHEDVFGVDREKPNTFDLLLAVGARAMELFPDSGS